MVITVSNSKIANLPDIPNVENPPKYVARNNHEYSLLGKKANVTALVIINKAVAHKFIV